MKIDEESSLSDTTGLFLSVCGNNKEVEERHFSEETDNWSGETILELTTDPDYEKVHMEFFYKGETNQPDTIWIITVGQDNNPDTGSGTGSGAALTEKGIYYKEIGSYGYEDIYANEGNFGVIIEWSEGQEFISFEEDPE
ncbi:hypothetical protein MKX54_01770 [Alkalihalobacillus sp. FSL R5-0424]